MSAIDELRVLLRSLEAGVERVVQDIEGAEHAARAVAERAARNGFAGIAAGATRLRQAVTHVGTRVTAVATAIRDAVAVTAAVGEQPSPQTTVDVLTTVGRALSRAHHRIGAAIEATGTGEGIAP